MQQKAESNFMQELSQIGETQLRSFNQECMVSRGGIKPYEKEQFYSSTEQATTQPDQEMATNQNSHERLKIMKTDTDERFYNGQSPKNNNDSFNFCIQLNSFDQRCNRTREMVAALSKRLNDIK